MENIVKTKLKNGQKTVGGFLQTLSPVSAEILSQCGFDWLIVDLEHAPGDFANLQQQLQAMNGSDVVPFARAPWNDEVAIKRILDTGVMGVLVPYVNTRAEAEAAVAACKYPPQGIRGVAGSPRAAGYTGNTMTYLQAANAERRDFAGRGPRRNIHRPYGPREQYGTPRQSGAPGSTGTDCYHRRKGACV
jgi:2-dehydro-3-deoxyglucarate aldolase/4-hydroxy-2-oxoheptanedioate aldolase